MYYYKIVLQWCKQKIWPITEDLKFMKVWLKKSDSLLILLRENHKGNMILNVVSDSFKEEALQWARRTQCIQWKNEADLGKLLGIAAVSIWWQLRPKFIMKHSHIMGSLIFGVLSDRKIKLNKNTGAWICKYTYRPHWKQLRIKNN